MPDELEEIMNLTTEPTNFKKNDVWLNADNELMYENLPINIFEKLAALSGIDDNKDIDAIYDKYIRDAESILELGAGYGRVVDEVLKRGYSKHITCVDRNKPSLDHIQNNFRHAVDVICADIATFSSDRKYDVILWLWFGFAEFSKNEQLEILERCAPMLSERGCFIIDLVHIDSQLAAQHNHIQKNPYFHTKYGTNYHYLPSQDEMAEYAEKCQLAITNIIPYAETYMKKSKILYVLSK